MVVKGMDAKSLAFLALRVLAICLFIFGLRHLANLADYSLMTYLRMLESSYYIVLAVSAPTLVLIVGGVLLWVFADKLSRFMLPKQAAESGGSTGDIKALEGFVFSVVGLILAILSFTRLAGAAIDYFRMANIEYLSFDQQGYLISMAEQAIRFVIGLFLIFKAEGLALLLRRFRNLGLNGIKHDQP